MKKYIRTLTVYFDTELQQKEIPFFRGAVLKSLGDKASLLYHNHTGDHTFRYSYPLIQYKRINGKAAIVCVEEGVEYVSEILSTHVFHLKIGERQKDMLFNKIDTEQVDIEDDSQTFYYTLEKWLPLNSKNYQIFQSTEDLVERIKILSGILTANILSFLKGMGVYINRQLNVSITNIQRQNIIKYKGVGLTAFDISFSANISLPLYIGIGKNASVGCGIITKKKTNNTTGL